MNRHVVQYQQFTPGKDSHGATIDAWGPVEAITVFGWAPAATGRDRQPIDDNRRPVITDLQLLVPAGTPGAPRDKWILLGQPYEQVGAVEDYTHGPRPGGGYRINLRRVDG